MRLREAFSDDPTTLVLSGATLARLGLDEEAAVPRFDEAHHLVGAVVACDRALVELTLEEGGAVGASVHAWRDVSPPELTSRTYVELQVIEQRVQVRLSRPPIELGTAPFDIGTADWQMASTPAAIAFWAACVSHTGMPEAGLHVSRRRPRRPRSLHP